MVNWHYVRDDHMFSTIKLVSRHQNTQQLGAAPPKPKASARRTRSSSDTSITPPTVAASPRLTASAKGKQTAKASKAKSLSAFSEGFSMHHESEEELFWNSTNDEGADNEGKDGDGDEEDEGDDGEEGDGDDDDDDEDDDDEEGDNDDADQEVERDDEEEGGDDEQDYDEEEYNEETRNEESFDPTLQTPKNSNDEGNGDEDLGLNIGGEEGHVEEEDEDELYRDVNINQGRGIQANLEVEDSHVTLTPVNPDGQQQSSSVSSQFVTSMHNPTLDVVPSTIIQNLPSFGSLFGFDNRLRTFEANFSDFMQTNQFAGAVFAIPRIVQRYMDQRMNEAVQVAVQIQSDRLGDEAQRENDEFLKSVDENMQKIIKEQVKKQVKVQVSKILPRIEQAVNEQLKAEVLTRSSHSSKTSYDVAADLLEMELKKILIEKMEGNKSIQRSDEQRNLYKAIVEAYESDKIILDTYGETGSKRRREGKEPESASAPTETATRSAGRSTQGSQSRQASASESAFAEEPKPRSPDCNWNKTVPAIHGSIQPWISELAKRSDSRSSFNELMDTPLDFSNFLINRLKVDTLTPKLLAGPTYELMKGSCKSLVELEYHLEEVFKATTNQLDWVNPEGQQYPHNLLKPLPVILNNRGRRAIPFEHFINNDLEYLRGGASSSKYTTSITKTKAADYGHIKWIEDLVPRTMWIEEPIGYDKHALWGVSHWGRKHQQFYGFAVNRESARDVYSKRRIIVVTELKIVEWHSYKHLDWITRRVEYLQLGVESYQKKLYLTKPDSYRSDLKRKEAYTAYSNPWRFIYQNKDKKNRKSDKDRAVVMIQAIDNKEEGCTRETSGRYKGPYDLSYAAPIFQKPEPEGSTQGYPLVLEVLRYDKRSKSEYTGIMPTEMKLILEHTKQGISHEVSVSIERVEELKRNVKINDVKKEALLTH
uniref:Uncharacterized protein n=1 Tax=Tanacetum cinerariifolium TaxID=118510 RepID=A0A6L2J283_TANCI|nr:hypothetical protein [Tanacetum cinerariifolium]